MVISHKSAQNHTKSPHPAPHKACWFYQAALTPPRIDHYPTRRDGIELNGVDIRNIRTRVLEMLSYRRRVQMYQEKEKITYQWKKPERLRR
ncbi:hypothetical protein GU837_01450 [Escherichia coli]|nr:hypothetical protein [Escherichia coli]